MADQCYGLVTAQIYLASKGKYIHEAWGQADPQEERGSILAPLFMFFLLPMSLPYVNWAKPGRLLVLPEVLTPVLRCSFVIFSQAFPFFVFQPPPFWTPSYSNYLTVLILNLNIMVISAEFWSTNFLIYFYILWLDERCVVITYISGIVQSY